MVEVRIVMPDVASAEAVVNTMNIKSVSEISSAVGQTVESIAAPIVEAWAGGPTTSQSLLIIERGGMPEGIWFTIVIVLFAFNKFIFD